ncbi:MAG: pyridoxal 5'-phosphate synthase glutaminase subunit PdxT [Euryarchaeota archaeon]
MLQGSRHEHMHSLQQSSNHLGFEITIRELRKSSDVEGIDALVLPGGESTAMKIAGKSEDLYQKLWEYITKSRIPVLGTCAGAILLSQKKLISADIERNAFGRQINSFESELRIDFENTSEFQGVFIRAPRFSGGSDNAIAWLNDEVVGIKEGEIVALTFHPELTENLLFHNWLIQSAKSRLDEI